MKQGRTYLPRRELKGRKTRKGVEQQKAEQETSGTEIFHQVREQDYHGQKGEGNRGAGREVRGNGSFGGSMCSYSSRATMEKPCLHREGVSKWQKKINEENNGINRDTT